MQPPDSVVYTWESELRRPGRFLLDAFRDLRTAGGISWRMFVRDLKAQYRETLLGALWLWVPALTVSGTFILAENANLVSGGNTSIPYGAYVIISTVLWQLFAEAFAAPIKAIETAKPLLNKLRFPAESIVLARILDVVLSFLIKLPLIIGCIVWFKLPVNATILLFPVGVVALFCMGLSLGMLLVPIGGLYQDVVKTLPLALTFWMFLTPVVFAPSVEGLLGRIVALNPVTPLLVTSREWLVGTPVSSLGAFGIVASVSVLGLVVSWCLFRLSIPIIVERAGN
jgi:lipopolysaccharide transport system permease protein